MRVGRTWIAAGLWIFAACGGEMVDGDNAPTEALALTPTDGEAISLLGTTYYQPQLAPAVLATYEANLAEAEADLAENPNDVEAMIWVGRRTAYLGRLRESIDRYTEALRVHPDDARLYRHRGHRLVSIREFDLAIRDFDEATRLIEGTEDSVEPDGLPNAMGIPTSTLHFNIWYHLGLAHYLKGDYEAALEAYEACLLASKHPDSVVATTYWLHNTLLKLGRMEEAEAALATIHADMDIIESTSYLDVLLLHKGERSVDELQSPSEGALASVTTAYGVGLWHASQGRQDQAVSLWEDLVERQASYSAFGFLAAEAELAQLR